ncbi:uncharacterized protein LOC117550834 [Gymnodraco acuticeps]|uniref:Uncharacterized protein LOC117550834 n=1 Tax=Gymnodraco acuticeps TaxID=8218 RepID=A0A6P8US28_GYMAC|nr:uncharacterized protein LOC117550834 [Gymnodraco acuticeps]
MPVCRVVYGCSNRSGREKNKRFYRVPKVVVHKAEQFKKLTEERREKWLSNLHLRSGGAESSNARVCSDHFIRGCPSALGDVESVDWAPTVSLGYHTTSKPRSEASLRREQRMELKEDQQRQSECAEALLDLLQTTESPEPTQPPSDSPQPEDTSGILNDQQDAGCQTDLTMEDIERMEDVLRQNTTELGDLRTKALDTKFNQESFENNEEKTKFYTGLPNFLVLLQVFQLCEPYITFGPMSVLSKFQQFILVLLRLRLNLPLKDLAFRFNISLSTASRIWHKLIDILHESTEFIIEWPERHVLQATMPMGFRLRLKMPAFTRGKSQLSAYKVEETRKIANVRIHVERVIRLVRRKYQILQSRAVPIEHMLTKPGEALALIDKIGVICCALSNLSVSVVPLE